MGGPLGRLATPATQALGGNPVCRSLSDPSRPRACGVGVVLSCPGERGLYIGEVDPIRASGLGPGGAGESVRVGGVAVAGPYGGGVGGPRPAWIPIRVGGRPRRGVAGAGARRYRLTRTTAPMGGFGAAKLVAGETTGQCTFAGCKVAASAVSLPAEATAARPAITTGSPPLWPMPRPACRCSQPGPSGWSEARGAAAETGDAQLHRAHQSERRAPGPRADLVGPGMFSPRQARRVVGLRSRPPPQTRNPDIDHRPSCSVLATFSPQSGPSLAPPVPARTGECATAAPHHDPWSRLVPMPTRDLHTSCTLVPRAANQLRVDRFSFCAGSSAARRGYGAPGPRWSGREACSLVTCGCHCPI